MMTHSTHYDPTDDRTWTRDDFLLNSDEEAATTVTATHRPAFYGHFHAETQTWDLWWITPTGLRVDHESRPQQGAVSAMEALVQKVTAASLAASLEDVA